MFSYEKAGWLGYPDLGFSNQNLGKWAGKFYHMNISSRLPGITITITNNNNNNDNNNTISITTIQ